MDEAYDIMGDIFRMLEMGDYQLIQSGFFPKQIEQLKKLRDEGFFDDIIRKR